MPRRLVLPWTRGERLHRRLSQLGATPLGTLLLAAVAAAACGTVVHRHGYVVLAAIVSTLAVGLAWPWLAVRPLRATLAFDADRGREGQPAGFRVSIRNRGPLPVAGLTLVGLGEGPIRLPTVGAFAALDLSIPFAPPRRGVYPTGPVAVACGLPFGLWHPRRSVQVDRTLLAWPAEAAVALPVELRGRRSVATALASASHAPGEECHGVRPYRRGDAVRLIHHAQTARHDRLIVRESGGAGRSVVRIALDSAEASYGPAAREHAIRIAAGLCAACLQAGFDVDAVVEGRIVRPGRPTLDALARIGAPGGPPAADLLALPACQGRGRLVVLVTSDRARPPLGPAVVVPVAEPDAPREDVAR